MLRNPSEIAGKLGDELGQRQKGTASWRRFRENQPNSFDQDAELVEAEL
jgi:hypothetical protein